MGDVAFRISLQRRHPKVDFRGSIPSLHFPLSTLPHALAGRRGMTRGRCGSLYLQRMKLAFTTICRRNRRFQGVRTEIEKALADFDPLDVFNLCGDSLPYSRDRTLGAIEALEEAKERGQIKYYGFSTHTLDYAINMIENHPEFTLVMVPFNITTSQVCERLFPVVRKHQTGVVGMKALAARGFLNVDINPGDFGRGLSVSIAAIKWVLQSSEISCTIPAMNSIEEVEENIRASGSALTDEEIKMLDEVKVKFNETIEKEDRSWYFFRDWVKKLR